MTVCLGFVWMGKFLVQMRLGFYRLLVVSIWMLSDCWFDLALLPICDHPPVLKSSNHESDRDVLQTFILSSFLDPFGQCPTVGATEPLCGFFILLSFNRQLTVSPLTPFWTLQFCHFCSGEFRLTFQPSKSRTMYALKQDVRTPWDHHSN